MTFDGRQLAIACVERLRIIQRIVGAAQQLIDSVKRRRIALIFQKTNGDAGNGDARFDERMHAIAQVLLLGVKHAGALEVLPVAIDRRIKQPTGDHLQKAKNGQCDNNPGDHANVFQHNGSSIGLKGALMNIGVKT